MSAYIVADETVNRIVDLCSALFFGVPRGPARYVHFRYPSRPAGDGESSQKFGSELLAMNCDAVAARYGSVEEFLEGEPDPRTGYRYCRVMPGDACEWDYFQVVKSLDCYLYQCNEGDIEKRPLYIALERLREDLSSGIINCDPRYEAARWG
jgi:hypothetical protein